MAKQINYVVTLFPAVQGPRPGLFSVRFLIAEKLPERKITATSIEDALAQAEAFAVEHGKLCKASIRVTSPRKPAGFDAKTGGFGFFNVPA